jgi:hypothetical protein
MFGWRTEHSKQSCKNRCIVLNQHTDGVSFWLDGRQEPSGPEMQAMASFAKEMYVVKLHIRSLTMGECIARIPGHVKQGLRSIIKPSHCSVEKGTNSTGMIENMASVAKWYQ